MSEQVDSRNRKRELVFGLTAVQHGLIKPEDFLKVASAWHQSSSRRFSELCGEMLGLSDLKLQAIQLFVAESNISSDSPVSEEISRVAEVFTFRVPKEPNIDPDLRDEIVQLAKETATNDLGDTRLVTESSDFETKVSLKTDNPISSGGEGIVYSAVDGHLSRKVALKRPRSNKERDRDRFRREGRILAMLQHPGIVPIYVLGESEKTGPFFCMSLLGERSTFQIIIADYHIRKSKGLIQREQEAIEFRNLIQQMVQICQTMAYAHSMKIIHRDLKPKNIMVGNHGEVYVIDWGFALDLNYQYFDEKGQFISDDSEGISSHFPGAIGTNEYIPWEQLHKQYPKHSEKSDVFTLGGTLFYILCCKAPFASTINKTAAMRATEFDLVKPSEITSGVDPALEAICMKALQKEPEDRYQSATAMMDDLNRWLADEPVSVYREPRSKRLERWAKRNRAVVTNAVSVGIVLLVSSLAVAYFMYTARNQAIIAKTEEIDAKNEAVAAKNEAVKARNVAMENYANMVQFSKANFTLLKSVIPFAKGQQKNRFEQLKNQSVQLEAILQKNPEDPELVMLCLDAFHETANAARYIFEKDAESYYLKAFNLIKANTKLFTSDDAMLQTANLLMEQSELYRMTGRYQSSYSNIMEARKSTELLLSKNQNNFSALVLKLQIQNNLAVLYLELGMQQLAEEAIASAFGVLNQNFPADFKSSLGFATLSYVLWNTNGEIQMNSGKKAEAIKSFDFIIDATDPAKNNNAMNPDISFLRANALNNQFILKAESKEIVSRDYLRLNEINRIFSELFFGLAIPSAMDNLMAQNGYLNANVSNLRKDIPNADQVSKRSLENISQSIAKQDQIQKRIERMRLLNFRASLLDSMGKGQEAKEARALEDADKQAIKNSRAAVILE